MRTALLALLALVACKPIDQTHSHELFIRMEGRCYRVTSTVSETETSIAMLDHPCTSGVKKERVFGPPAPVLAEAEP